MNAELTKLLQEHASYARFLKVDLHVHTPATPWCWNQHNPDTPAGSLSPTDVAKAILASDLDLVAITDHDTVEWVEPVMREVRRLSKGTGRVVTVLPGVEVTTYDGVHLLAIFPQNKPIGDIRNLLIRFGLRADGTVSERASSDFPLAKVVHALTETDALIIAPHANHPKMGIWGGSKSEHRGKRTAWMHLPAISILACAKGQISGIRNGLRGAGIKKSFCFIQHSDSHSFGELGKRATYIKLAEPTLDGLRQVIHEPNLRVSFEQPDPPRHPHLLALQVHGGYFDRQTMAFSPHLNTLIGGNHAGKSALIDAIRFVFDDPCYLDAEEKDRLLKRVKGIISDGGVVRCWFTDDEGQLYRVERQVAIRETGSSGTRKSYHAEISPVLTRLADDVEIRDDRNPLDVIPLDFYGQGSVGRIARNADNHRQLIDSMSGCLTTASRLDPLSSTPSSLIQQIRTNAVETERAEERAAALKSEYSKLPELKEQVRELRGKAQSEVLEHWSKWEAGNRIARRAAESLSALAEQLASPEDIVQRISLEGASVGLESADVHLEKVRKSVEALDRLIQDGLKKLQSDAKHAIDSVRKALEQWRLAYESEEKRKSEILRESQLTSHEALLKHIAELDGRIEELETVVRPTLDSQQEKLVALEEERRSLWDQLDAEWSTLRRQRKEFIDKLNAATVDDVTIAMEEGTDSSRLADLLNKIIDIHSSRGQLVQRREREIQKLIGAFGPRDLCLILLANDSQALTTTAQVTANTADFFCNLPTSAKLEIALAYPEDVIVIQFRREGESEHTSLEKLSRGEQALALLTVAFANDGAPIVIDQPEDELGQLLVTSALVDTIRQSKQQRQFVVVTHNANIPVLGDAEAIFCMKNEYDDVRTRNCFVDAVGAVECRDVRTVLLALEGGEQSFLRRKAKYNIADVRLESASEI